MLLEAFTAREIVGYLASGLVLAAFCVKDMLPLRVIAIASNLAFISYGYLEGLRPVLLLHLLLLPTNLLRLWQLVEAVPARPGSHLRSVVGRREERVRGATRGASGAEHEQPLPEVAWETEP